MALPFEILAGYSTARIVGASATPTAWKILPQSPLHSLRTANPVPEAIEDHRTALPFIAALAGGIIFWPIGCRYVWLK